MPSLSQLLKANLNKEYRTLIKAGVLHNDLTVRDEEFVLAYLVKQNLEGLAKAAQEQLDEAKAEK